jgi:hypothetical protein
MAGYGPSSQNQAQDGLGGMSQMNGSSKPKRTQQHDLLEVMTMNYLNRRPKKATPKGVPESLITDIL